MKKVWILWYKWMDIPGSRTAREAFYSEADAIAERDKLLEAERRWPTGQLQIVIDVYVFESQHSCELV